MSRLNNAARRTPRFWYRNSVLAILLQPVAYVFQAVVAMRRWAYRRGFIRRHTISVPVVVVGNLTVGGTGKTPLVAWLAHELIQGGRKPGIVSRGHGGHMNRRPTMVTPTSDAKDVGDEPLLLAIRTEVPVCICVDRVAAARQLLSQADVDIVISDDGLQHYRLSRDLEFAVLDAQRMLGNGRLLPAGPLREPPQRLREVDVVFVNGPSAYPGAHCFELSPGDAIELGRKSGCALSEFCGKRVWSVAGIGNPERFHSMLASFGIEPVPVDVADHGLISLLALRNEAPYPILMTEKDAVKYLADPVADSWYVPVTVKMSQAARDAVMTIMQSELDGRAAGG